MRLLSSRSKLQDSLEEINEFLYNQGCADDLPVAPPTQDRVTAMVEYAQQDPQRVVARLHPAMGEATIEEIAINAVMAGCEPKHVPVLIAAVEAVAEEPFNLHAIQAGLEPPSGLRPLTSRFLWVHGIYIGLV
jgi:hypothetical protein